jgi:soluble lytic murein transglycosylase-like protein
VSKGSNTTTTSQSPTALPAYQSAIGQLQQVGATPYTPYGGELVSPVNQQQYTGIGGINQNAYTALPYLQSAESTLQGAANPLTAGQIQQYYSPYQQDVVGATEAQFNNQNAIQQQQVLGNAAAQGALGGDRTAVAQSVLAGQQQAQEAPVIAGLENQGYTQALQTAAGQFQQNPEQAAYGIANTGQAIENAGLTGANAQVGAGTLEQQTQQAQDTAAYQQAMMAQFMPESMLSWELPLLTGVGSQEGGTSTTTGPAPNPLAQYLGLGIAGVGAAGQAGGSAGIAGLAPLFARKGGRVQGLQTGGVPDSFGFTPGALPGNPWLVPPQMQRGPGAPPPPKIPGQTVQTPQQMMANAKGLAGAMKSAVGSSTDSPAFGGGNALTDSFGGSSSAPLAGLDTSDYGVGFKEGGRIFMKRGGTPVRAGLGMASFMPRRHFDSGGSATDDVMVDDRPSSGWSAALSPVSPVAAAYGAQNPYASAQVADASAAPVAGIGTTPEAPRMVASAEAPPLAPSPQAAPSAPPQAGIGAAAPNYSPTQHAIVNAARNEGIDPKWALAIAHQESGAQHYDANGNPKVSSAGAIGTMQLMPETAKDLGVNPYDPGQNIQGGVHYLKQMLDRYGGDVQLASAAYNAGPKRVDAFVNKGTPLPGETQNYVPSVMAFAGDAASGIGSRGTGLSTAPDSVNAPPAKAAPKSGIGSPDFYQSLMAAGLGMMASRSPFLGVAVGEGGLQGLGTYTNLKNREQDVDLKVRQLDQQAKAESDRIGLAAKAQEFAQTQMTPAQKAEAEFRERNLQREMQQPVKLGTDMSTGTDIMGVRDPNAPGGFRRIDLSGAPTTPQGTGAPLTTPGTPTPPTSQEQLPTSSSPVSGETPPNVKPEVLASLDPNLASQVKALDEGRMAFPTGFALKSPYWQNILRLVSNYDPSFDAVNYNARAKTRADFVAGKSAQNITSFNTAIGHLDTLDKSIDNLGNTNYSWLNSPLQSVKSAAGDTGFQAAQKQFMAAKQAVTDELTRAFRGSGGNVHDIVGWEQTLNQADSPAALHAATKAAVDLLRSRIESVGDQYNRGMGTTRDPLTMLSPHAQAAVARLSGEGASSAPQFTGRTATNPKTGEKLRETADGKWVP